MLYKKVVKKLAGRPRKEYRNVVFVLTMPPILKQQLQRMAGLRRMSLARTVRIYVTGGLDRDKARFNV